MSLQRPFLAAVSGGGGVTAVLCMHCSAFSLLYQACVACAASMCGHAGCSAVLLHSRSRLRRSQQHQAFATGVNGVHIDWLNIVLATDLGHDS